MPDTFTITEYGNYPNPFDNSTVFFYKLGNDADSVTIRLYTLSGRLIEILECEENKFGYNEETWTVPEDIAGGVYLYKITAKSGEENISVSGKMIRMKQ